MPKQVNIYDTAIHVRVRRFEETFFILCDEYETVQTLKGRILVVLNQIGFKLPKQTGDLGPDELRLCLQKRVLDADSTCHDQQVFNDTLLYLLIAPPREDPKQPQEFEDLEKVAGEIFEYAYPQKKKEEPKKTEE